MSKVFRALEKAEREKQVRPVREEPVVEIFDVESISPKNGEQGFQDLEDEIERFELPEKEGELIPVAGAGTFAVEQFRKLKTHLFRMAPKPPRCLLITSTVPQEGKTVVTMNLAMSIAQEFSKKVIVIDADLRKPSLYPVKFSHRKGLSDYLSGETPVSEVIKGLNSGKLSIIPGGSPCANPAELISSGKMRDLIVGLRGRDEDTYVLIDSPPILSSSEPLMLSEWVDGIVFVVMADQAGRGSVEKAVRAIDREKILGIVFNSKELKPDKIYSDYYYRSYKK